MSAGMSADLPPEDVQDMVEQLALFFERFGFRPNLGRIWATLYLSDRPLCQQELCERLELSAGLVSTSLRELVHWEMIRPVLVAGERRTCYRTEDQLLRIVTAILFKRESIAVRDLKEAVARVRKARKAGRGKQYLERLSAIEDAAELYLALANLVAATARLPGAALRPVIRLVRNLRPGGGSTTVEGS